MPFSTTCLCELCFSSLTHIKNKYREHLRTVDQELCVCLSSVAHPELIGCVHHLRLRFPTESKYFSFECLCGAGWGGLPSVGVCVGYHTFLKIFKGCRDWKKVGKRWSMWMHSAFTNKKKRWRIQRRRKKIIAGNLYKFTIWLLNSRPTSEFYHLRRKCNQIDHTSVFIRI